MLKIRLQGTKNDIKWFRKILDRNPKVDILEFSDYLTNQEMKKFYRVYGEIKKHNIEKSNQRKRV